MFRSNRCAPPEPQCSTETASTATPIAVSNDDVVQDVQEDLQPDLLSKQVLEKDTESPPQASPQDNVFRKLHQYRMRPKFEDFLSHTFFASPFNPAAPLQQPATRLSLRQQRHSSRPANNSTQTSGLPLFKPTPSMLFPRRSPYPILPGAAPCPVEECPRAFNSLSNLRTHLKVHKWSRARIAEWNLTRQREKDEKAGRGKFPCDQCAVRCSRKQALKCHKQTKHNVDSADGKAVLEAARKTKAPIDCPAPECTFTCRSRMELAAHCEDKHTPPHAPHTFQQQTIKFPDMAAFEAWQKDLEEKKEWNFSKESSDDRGMESKLYYWCRKANRKGDKGNNIRKKRELMREQRHCPAYVTVRTWKADKTVTVIACLGHIGHSAGVREKIIRPPPAFRRGKYKKKVKPGETITPDANEENNDAQGNHDDYDEHDEQEHSVVGSSPPKRTKTSPTKKRGKYKMKKAAAVQPSTSYAYQAAQEDLPPLEYDDDFVEEVADGYYGEHHDEHNTAEGQERRSRLDMVQRRIDEMNRSFLEGTSSQDEYNKWMDALEAVNAEFLPAAKQLSPQGRKTTKARSQRHEERIRDTKAEKLSTGSARGSKRSAPDALVVEEDVNVEVVEQMNECAVCLRHRPMPIVSPTARKNRNNQKSRRKLDDSYDEEEEDEEHISWTHCPRCNKWIHTACRTRRLNAFLCGACKRTLPSASGQFSSPYGSPRQAQQTRRPPVSQYYDGTH